MLPLRPRTGAEGWRNCSYCATGRINLCNAGVNAGDAILAWEGRLDWLRVRERCSRCQAVWITRRESCGPYVRLASAVADLCRLLSWRLRYRFGYGGPPSCESGLARGL